MRLESLFAPLSPAHRNTKACFASERNSGDTRRLYSAVMTANSLRWETLQALENSPKAKITFDPHWSERGEVSRILDIKATAVEALTFCCGAPPTSCIDY